MLRLHARVVARVAAAELSEAIGAEAPSAAEAAPLRKHRVAFSQAGSPSRGVVEGEAVPTRRTKGQPIVRRVLRRSASA